MLETMFLFIAVSANIELGEVVDAVGVSAWLMLIGDPEGVVEVLRPIFHGDVIDLVQAEVYECVILVFLVNKVCKNERGWRGGRIVNDGEQMFTGCCLWVQKGILLKSRGRMWRAVKWRSSY